MPSLVQRATAAKLKETIEDEETREYLMSWIKKNLIDVDELDVLADHGGPGRFRIKDSSSLDWGRIGIQDIEGCAEVRLVGDSVDDVQYVYLGCGFRVGYLVRVNQRSDWGPFEEMIFYSDDRIAVISNSD
jgi:hypothetical protein